MKLRWVVLCLAISVGVACSPNGGLIYSIIETEKKVVDSTLPSPKTQTIADVVSAAAGGPYYVAMGPIFRGVSKADGTIDWTGGSGSTATPVKPPADGAACNALAYYAGHLWGGFNTAGSVLGLYESTTVSGAETFEFEPPVANTAVAGKQITLVQAVNGNLFVVTAVISATDYVYDLQFFNGTAWSTVLASTPTAPIAFPITGVAWDGTSYWAVSGSTVYQGTSANPPAFTQVTSLGTFAVASSNTIGGVFASGTTVIIPTKTQGVYAHVGGTWYNPTASVSGVNVGFLSAGGPVDASGDFVVGSDGYGYFLLSSNGQTLTRPTDSLDTTIGLYTSAVRRILVDPNTPDGTRDRVFMGTAGEGLWRAAFDKSTGLPDSNGWTHE